MDTGRIGITDGEVWAPPRAGMPRICTGPQAAPALIRKILARHTPVALLNKH